MHIETFIILSAFYFKYFQRAKMMKICCYTSWNDDMKENDVAFQNLSVKIMTRV